MSGHTGTELRATDAALIQKIVQRDESALAALYDRYASLLSSLLNRILRDTQASEEILQDVFFQLWRNAAQFDPARGSLPGWLAVIARNRAISRLRRHNPSAGEELAGDNRHRAGKFGKRASAAAIALTREERVGKSSERAARRHRAGIF